MKKFTLIAFLVLTTSPVFAARNGCNATMATATCKNVCDTGTQVLWSIAVSPEADAKLTTALARKSGWTATVVCTQAMVDLAQCTAQQLGTQVANPVTEVQAARAEFRRMLREEYIKSLDAENIRSDSASALAAALAAITDPDTGN